MKASYYIVRLVRKVIGEPIPGFLYPPPMLYEEDYDIIVGFSPVEVTIQAKAQYPGRQVEVLKPYKFNLYKTAKHYLKHNLKRVPLCEENN